jgi:hypothetical protein
MAITSVSADISATIILLSYSLQRIWRNCHNHRRNFEYELVMMAGKRNLQFFTRGKKSIRVRSGERESHKIRAAQPINRPQNLISKTSNYKKLQTLLLRTKTNTTAFCVPVYI